MTIIVSQQNTLTQTWTVATVGGVLTGTLVISNNVLYDMKLTDIVRIADTTTGITFGINATTTFSNTFVSGKPTYTWVIGNVPAGTVSVDTVLVYIDVQPNQLLALQLQYQKA
jgi:hypothetical protein